MLDSRVDWYLVSLLKEGNIVRALYLDPVVLRAAF